MQIITLSGAAWWYGSITLIYPYA